MSEYYWIPCITNTGKRGSGGTMAAFPRHDCKYFKDYDCYKVKTRYIDTVIEVDILVIFSIMVNL